MPGNNKKVWIAMAVVLAVGVSIFAIVRYRSRPLTITGAVTVQDTDVRKQLPISDVVVSVANDLAAKPTKTDGSGFFSIRLFKHVRRGAPFTLEFHHPGYQPLKLREVAGDDIYVAHLAPLHPEPEPGAKRSGVKIGGIVVRYSFKTLRSVDVGSAVKTFEVVNKANVPCDGSTACSPDHKWKANIGSFELNAGPGNEFHDVRLSCIAGPCPFTRIQADNFGKGGQIITASVLGWADTTTFLVEGEVTHTMVTQTEHRSYPVIFGPTLNFTLPTDAEGVSLEADVAGQSVIFPLGPDLLLSWATCSGTANTDKSRIYRCELKPGYQFQQ